MIKARASGDGTQSKGEGMQRQCARWHERRAGGAEGAERGARQSGRAKGAKTRPSLMVALLDTQTHTKTHTHRHTRTFEANVMWVAKQGRGADRSRRRERAVRPGKAPCAQGATVSGGGSSPTLLFFSFSLRARWLGCASLWRIGRQGGGLHCLTAEYEGTRGDERSAAIVASEWACGEGNQKTVAAVCM